MSALLCAYTRICDNDVAFNIDISSAYDVKAHLTGLLRVTKQSSSTGHNSIR
jgi:hypothetical protein